MTSGDAHDMGNAEASISIRQLGYAPRPQKLMYIFDHDEALAYLAHKELLVAYNSHRLLTRHTLGSAGQTVRVIHVAVVNTETRQIEHSADWELPDNDRYLWPLADGRVCPRGVGASRLRRGIEDSRPGLHRRSVGLCTSDAGRELCGHRRDPRAAHSGAACPAQREPRL